MRLGWAGQSLRRGRRTAGNRILQEPGHAIVWTRTELRYRGKKNAGRRDGLPDRIAAERCSIEPGPGYTLASTCSSYRLSLR